MKSLIFFLIKEAIPLLIGGDLIRRNVQRLLFTVALYLVLSLLGLVAIIFLYIFLDRWLTSLLGSEAAAAILCAINLALIGGILIVRSIMRPRRSIEPKRSITTALSTNPNFDVGMEAGRHVGKILRKAAPKIATGAAILGLIMSAKPVITFILRRRSKGSDNRID